jgi:hypothetical protein
MYLDKITKQNTGSLQAMSNQDMHSITSNTSSVTSHLLFSERAPLYNVLPKIWMSHENRL